VVVEVSASTLFPLIIIAKDPFEALQWLGIVMLLFGFTAALFCIASGVAYVLTSALNSHFVRRGQTFERLEASVLVAMAFTPQ
jgi:drug/metabolite transporter (DMT)-like permease